MSEADMINFLWLHGYFWDRSRPNTLNVKERDLSTLELADRVVQEAVQAFQNADSNLTPLAFVNHGRAPIADGDVGPATQQLARIARCPMPDHPPPPNASFHYNNADLQDAVLSYQQWGEATGSGSWPVGCDSQYKNVHSVVVSILTAGFSSHQKSVMKEVLELVKKCEAEVGQSVRFVLDGDSKAAQHDVRAENIPGGVIGYAYFPIPGRCNQSVVARIDNTFNANVRLLGLLFTHEFKGHSDGLEHTKGGIMNPSIIDVEHTWFGDPSERKKVAFFGGEPIKPPPPPGPPPAKYHVRLRSNTTAGDYGDFAFGSDMGAGDYLMLLTGDGLPPFVP